MCYAPVYLAGKLQVCHIFYQDFYFIFLNKTLCVALRVIVRTHIHDRINHCDVCTAYITLVFLQVTKSKNVFDCRASARAKFNPRSRPGLQPNLVTRSLTSGHLIFASFNFNNCTVTFLCFVNFKYSNYSSTFIKLSLPLCNIP